MAFSSAFFFFFFHPPSLGGVLIYLYPIHEIIDHCPCSFGIRSRFLHDVWSRTLYWFFKKGGHFKHVEKESKGRKGKHAKRGGRTTHSYPDGGGRGSLISSSDSSSLISTSDDSSPDFVFGCRASLSSCAPRGAAARRDLPPLAAPAAEGGSGLALPEKS